MLSGPPRLRTDPAAGSPWRRRRVLAVLFTAASVLAVGTPAAATREPEPVTAETEPVTQTQPVTETKVEGETEIGVEALAEVVAAVDDPLGLAGEEAIAALEATETVEIVAERATLEPAQLVAELAEDSSLRVTEDASLLFVDQSVPVQGSAAPAPIGVAPLAAPAGANVFALESLPGGQRVLYLDFDGHVTSGDPHWNSGGDSIVSSRYSGSRDAIYEIWWRVAEDYAPFGVNVTTRDPGVEGLRRSSSSDPAYGQRIVVTPDNWTGAPRTHGLALVGVFGSELDRPAFVFTQSLSVAGVAEAISHEAGHTFGLLHDGTSTSGYYSGHGPWAPIMGYPIGKAITQWSRGEYPGANNREDDIGTIASYVGYRGDESSPANPTVVACRSTSLGTIGPGDTDAFAVDVGTGPLNVAVRPVNPGSNLHARLVVRDPNGTVVDSAEPTSVTGWSASVSTNAVAGRYTARVEPMGWGTHADGFGTYGSMGRYSLSVDGQPSSVGACATKFSPVTPNRLLDTRRSIGGYTRLRGGTQAAVQVTGTSGIPAGATAAVVNVTAVTPSGWGYLTVHPCEETPPETSNVNYIAGQVVANTTIAALSSSGRLCVWTYADADVIVDVTGWLGPSGKTRLTAVGPTRVVDTRSNIAGTRLGPGQTLTVDFAGKVPANASAVSFNLTAVGATEGGYLTAYPCGRARPDTSVVNHVDVEARPNNAIVGLSGGKLCIYSYAAADVIVDLTGYFAPNGELSYVPTAPRRLLDTRNGQVRPPMPAGSALTYGATAGLSAGLSPAAAFVNVTSTDHPTEGYVTTYGCGTVPYTSTVNQRLGQSNANGAIVPLQSSSRSCAWISEPAHILVDLNGWWVR